MSRQDPHNAGPVMKDGDPDDPPPRSRPISRLEQTPVELRDGDPDDPPPRSRPISRLEQTPVELRDGDPDDPPPRRQPVSQLVPAVGTKRAKPARRHRPAEKSAKRAGSRRR